MIVSGLWTCSKKVAGLDLEISTHYNPIYKTQISSLHLPFTLRKYFFVGED